MRARLRFFFSPSLREDPRDGLRQRQNFFRRNKRVEQLGHVRHGAQAAADVHLEAAFLLAVFSSRGWR